MTDVLRQISPDLRRRVEHNLAITRQIERLSGKGFLNNVSLGEFMTKTNKDLIPAGLAVQSIFAASPDDYSTGDKAKKIWLEFINPIEIAIIGEMWKIASPKERKKYKLTPPR